MVIHMEIERKYEILEIPSHLERYHFKRIEQGYLCHNPILRIRKSNEDYYLTYKSKSKVPKRKEGDAIIHEEVELPLTADAFQTLKKKTDGNMIYKTRYLIPLSEGLTVELDVFEKQLAGLIFAEVEFPDEKIANEFQPPKWLGKDLSFDRRYSNYYLSEISCFEELGI
jgi:adenylate cyclase